MAITNARIEKYSKKGEGDNNRGHWVKFDLLFEGDQQWYTYFQGQGEPFPSKGLELISAETDQKDPKYNPTLKKPVWNTSESTKTPPPVARNTKQDDLYINDGQLIIDGIKWSDGDMVKYREWWKLVALGKKVLRGEVKISDFTGMNTDSPPPVWDDDNMPDLGPDDIPF